MTAVVGRAGFRFVLTSAQSVGGGGGGGVDLPLEQTVTVTGSPTGGTFTLTTTGHTATLAYNAAAATVQTAVQAWGGNYAVATVTGSAGGPYTFDFPADTELLAGSASGLTGGTSPAVVFDPTSGGAPPPPPPDPTVAPPMPTTAKDSTWTKWWAQDFTTPIVEGQFGLSTSPYMGTASGFPMWGNGKFRAYTYPAYKDTRSKHTKPVTITFTAGSPNITSAGLFTPANYAIVGAYPEMSGYVPSDTQLVSITDTSHAKMDNNATTSGTVAALIRTDYGNYDERKYSVANGILSLHIHTTSDGKHHVGALIPLIGTTSSNQEGGRFALCMRMRGGVVAPTYKVAHLLWPQSNTSSNGGEIDSPEQNLDGTDTATMFMHWMLGGGQQTGHTTADLSDGNWHIFVTEHRPNPSNTALSNCKGYHADVVNGVIDAAGLATPFFNYTGAKVPSDPMHWVWQTETFLSYTKPIDPAVDTYLEYAWATYELPNPPIGTVQ